MAEWMIAHESGKQQTFSVLTVLSTELGVHFGQWYCFWVCPTSFRLEKNEKRWGGHVCILCGQSNMIMLLLQCALSLHHDCSLFLYALVLNQYKERWHLTPIQGCYTTDTFKVSPYVSRQLQSSQNHHVANLSFTLYSSTFVMLSFKLVCGLYFMCRSTVSLKGGRVLAWFHFVQAGKHF